jgi:hypothetical protein
MFANWTNAQWIVASAGGALLVGMFVVTLTSGAGVTWRRVVALLTVTTVVATTLFTVGGAAVSLPRNTILIASCRTDETRLEGIVRDLLGERRGKLVLFTAQDRESCATTLQQLETRLGTRLSRAYLVSLAERQTLRAFNYLVRLARTAAGFNWSYPVESLYDLIATPSVIFLYDAASPDWTDGIASDGIASSALLEDADLFVRNVEDAAFATTLEVTLPPALHADVPLRRINAPLGLTVSGGPARRSDRLLIDLCITLNGTTDLARCETEAAADRIFLRSVPIQRVAGRASTWRWATKSDPDNPILDDLLGDGTGSERATLPNNVLREGWNAFEFRARLTKSPDNGLDAGLVLPVRQVYVRAGGDGATIIVGAEPLASLAWPRPQSAAVAAPVLTAAWIDLPDKFKDFRRLRGLPLPPTLTDAAGHPATCLLKANADDALIAACLKRSKALILVEPDAALLARATARGWPQVITDSGGAVLVAAPTALDAATATTVAGWLPAVPVTGGPAPARIVRTRKIVAVGDCSGLAQMPVSDAVPAMRDATSPRPTDLQEAILAGVVKRLINAPNVTVSPIVTGADGTAKVLQIEGSADWRAPLETTTSVACIRSSKRDNINEPRDLLDFAQVDARLQALLFDRDDTPFVVGNRYPGSAVIVFTTLAPQAPVRALSAERIGAAFQTSSLAPSVWAPSTPNAALRRLASAGVAVILVELPTNRHLAAKALAATGNGETTTFESAATAWQAAGFVRRIAVAGIGEEAAAVDRIVAELNADADRTKAEVARVGFGRGLDPRFPMAPAAAPLAYNALTPIVREGRVLALIALGAPAAGQPLIVERLLGNGRVVVLGYSPFGLHEFTSDVLFSDLAEPALRAACGAPCPLGVFISNSLDASRMKNKNRLSSALGLQRVIDILEQSTRDQHVPDFPQLIAIVPGDAGDALDFVFAIPPGLPAWPQPVAVLPDAPAHCPLRANGEACPLHLAAFDSVAGRITYRLTTERPGGLEYGAYKLALGPGSDPIAEVPMVLRPRTLNESSRSPLLGALRALGAIPIRGVLPASERNFIEVATLVFLVMAGLLFSPLVRPWHAFDRFRQRARSSEDAVENALDADTIIERTAQIASIYEASRRAGDPAWIRPFVFGDSLSRAIVVDLVAFTSEGERQNFAPRPPRVRLREMRDSFDVVIGVDDSPALLHPGDRWGQSRKRAVTSLLVGIVAAAVTQHGGRWILVGLRDGTPLGPITGRDPDAVNEFLATRLVRHPDGSLIGPAAAKSGDAAVLLISDFLAAPIGEYISWLGSGRSSAILLVDREQEREVGLSLDAATGALYDRSTWDTADVAELLRLRQFQVRETVEQSGTPIAVIDMDFTDIEIADALIESGVLRFVRP